MPITSIGYEGTVDYEDWALLTSHLGAQYSVFGPDAFKVEAGVGDRALSVLGGRAAGQGILDESATATTLVGAEVSVGDRWDMVVLRRDWSTPGSGLVLVQGGATKALPGRSTSPGDQDDQPIALARFSAGQSAVQEIIDLRVWHGDGGCFARDRLVRDYLTRIGTRVYITDRTYVLTLNSAGIPTWMTDSVIFSATAPTPIDVPWLQVP